MRAKFKVLRFSGGAICLVIVCMAFQSRFGRAADYLVDPSYAGVDGAAFGSYAGAYKTVAAALGSGGVPSGASSSNVNRIYFASATYDTASVTGVSLVCNASNIALLGMSGNPDNVVITSTLDAAYNPGSGAIGTTGSSSLQIRGNNVSAKNITFANSTDTPYIVNVTHQAVSPQGNYLTGQSQTSNSQCVALKVQGDQNAFQNCKFLGYQDTLYVDSGRSYFKNCTVSGDIDFIFSKGTAVFNNSTINLDGDHSGGTVTAAATDKRTSNGLVFLNSTITGNSVRGNTVIDPFNAANASGPAANSMYLGRPWGWTQAGGDASTVLINTKMTPAIADVGWLNWNTNELLIGNNKNGGNPAKDSRYAEYNSMDLSSNPLDVSQRLYWSHQLTAGQATAYTVSNLFSPEGTGSGQYPWYGNGYPAGDANNPGTGSANPSDPNYSWPAFWGDRNSNNDTNNANVSQPYPTPGNPAGYTNPSWTIAGTWDAETQLVNAPEPSTLCLGGIAVGALIGSKWLQRRSRSSH